MQHRIWIVDSDDLGEPGEEVVVQTKAIQDFLRPESTARFMLVATKGYGKTLLLRAKRAKLEQRGNTNSFHLLPESALTDRPPGKIKDFSKGEIERIEKDLMFWENTWSLAITVAMIKFAQSKSTEVTPLDLDRLTSDGLRDIYLREDWRNITHHFNGVLALKPPVQYYKAVEDLKTTITPTYSNLNVPLASFIDNVDEHFDLPLTNMTSDSAPADWEAGDASNRFWYAGQMGLARAIRALHGYNKHVKIFASIRQEAFEKLKSEEQKALQFMGSALTLAYSFDDLRKIFVDNLVNEPAENCVAPRAKDPFKRFFGEENCELCHPHVGEYEHVWNYILRHTLLRPRDLMAIGKSLSDISPDQRTERRIRHAVNNASAEIADAYLNEIRPHLPFQLDFDRLFRTIPSNILSVDDIREVGEQYNQACKEANREDQCGDALGVLSRVGLLGRVKCVVGDNTQHFARPGKEPFTSTDVLPQADYYVIHSSLDEHIRRVSTYRFNNLNIAGAGRPWRDESNYKGVVSMDYVGFSQMKGAMEQAFKEDLSLAVEKCRTFLDNAQVIGDKVTLIDANPMALRKGVADVLRLLRGKNYEPRFRAGADYGVVILGPGGTTAGRPLVVSERVERYGEPDKVLMTRNFRDKLLEFDPELSYESARGLTSLKKLPRNGDAFNIKKEDNSHEDLWFELYCIDID